MIYYRTIAKLTIGAVLLIAEGARGSGAGPVAQAQPSGRPDAALPLSAVVQLGFSTISGRAEPGSTLSAQLVQRGGALKAMAATTVDDPNGYYSLELADPRGDARPLLAGDRLLISRDGEPVPELLLPDLTAEPDTKGDVVTGTAPPHSTVEVTLEHLPARPCSVTAVADGNGAYSAEFSGLFDLRRYTKLTARISYAAPSPYAVELHWSLSEELRVELHEGAIQGRGPAGGWLELDVARPGAGGVLARKQVRIGPAGTFALQLADSADSEVRLAPGDLLEARFVGLQVRRYVVPLLTAQGDGSANRVTGHAPASAQLTVIVDAGLGEEKKTIRVSTDGTYSAPFEEGVEIGPGSTGAVILGEGESWIASCAWDVPTFTIGIGTDEVSGVVATTGPPIRLLLYSPNGELRADASADPTGSDLKPRRGTLVAWLRGPTGDPVQLTPGDVLEYQRGRTTIELEVPLITSAADLESDEITGQAPAGAGLEIEVGHALGTVRRTATADEYGRYKVTLAPDIDVRAGKNLRIEWAAPVGHTFVLATLTQSLVIWPELGRFSGATASYGEVSAQLTDEEGREIASGAGVADVAGRFDIRLRDGTGTLSYPAVGDVLHAAIGGAETELAVEQLTLDWDLAQDEISGEARRGGTVEAMVRSPRGAPEQRARRAARLVFTDTYSISFTGDIDLRPGTRLQVVYRDGDGRGCGILRTLPMLNVQVGGDMVFGYALPHSQVTVSLARAGRILATEQQSTNHEQAFEAHFTDDGAEPLAIRAGDTLEASFGEKGIRLVAEEISARIDVAEWRVAGRAPTTEPIEIRLVYESRELWRTEYEAEPDGSYSALLPRDLAPARGSQAEVGVAVGEGHRVYALGTAARIAAHLGTARAEGLAQPLGSVQLTLSSAERKRLAEGTGVGDTRGSYSVELTGPGQPTIAAGERVALRSDGVATELVVPELSVSVCRDTGRVLGLAPTPAYDSQIALLVHLLGQDEPARATATQGMLGRYYYDPADRAGYDPLYSGEDVVWVQAIQTDEQGHQTVVRSAPSTWLYFPFIRRQ